MFARHSLPFVFTALTASAHAQIHHTSTSMFANARIDSVTELDVDAGGAVIAAGITDAPSGQLDGAAFVARWNAAGVLAWSSIYDASFGGAERPTAMVRDGAGGHYVAGSARGALVGQNGGFLLRIDATGAITWAIEHPFVAPYEWSPALAVDAQGRAVLAWTTPSGNGDLAITAYTPAGAVAWQTVHAGSGSELAESVALAPNGDVVVVATSRLGSTSKPLLVRLAGNGSLLQALEITTPEIVGGLANDVAVDADGRIYVACSVFAPGAAVSASALLGFDALGGLSWTNTITGPQQPFGGGAAAEFVEIDAFGRAIVAGVRAQGSAGRALLVAAYAPDGQEVWRMLTNDVLGGSSTNLWNLPARLVLDPSGEAYVVGSRSIALSDFESDAFVFAVDSTGAKRMGVAFGFPPTASGGSRDGAHAAVKLAGGALVIGGAAETSAGSVGVDAFVARFDRTAEGFCHGDGASAACPCGNASAAVERAGCASSLGVGGRLADLGASSLASDTLALVGTSMPNSNTLYFQGTTQLVGTTFGDGLRCASGTLVRLGVKLNAVGTSRYPASGDASVSVRGFVGAPGPRTYQAWYRNAASFCTSATFNTTNGLRVTWTP